MSSRFALAAGPRLRVAAISLVAAWAAARTLPALAALDCATGVGDPCYSADCDACRDLACFCGNIVTPAGGCASGDEMFWFRAGYVGWQRDGVNLPPLATASDPSVPEMEQGVLGFDTTDIIGGNAYVSDHWRGGFMLEGGVWLDPMTGWAIAADVVNTGRDSYGFEYDASDGRVLARPLFDVQADANRAKILNAPGILAGVVKGAAFDDLISAGGWMQKCVWTRGNACTGQGSARLSVLGGYRYYYHDSLVLVHEEFTALTDIMVGTSTLPTGTFTEGDDYFSGRSEFHGFEMGVNGRLQRCQWWLEGLAAVAFGGARRDVFVEGLTAVTPPNSSSVAVALPADLLVSNVTNFGRYTDRQGQVIPRFRISAGRQLSEFVGVRVGYNVIIWNGVVQAADHLPPDLAIDPRNLPPYEDPGATDNPVFPGIRDTTVVAHGLDLSLEVSF